MAALSDADMKAILGADYKHTRTDEEQSDHQEKLVQKLTHSRLLTLENSRLSAIILLIGGLIFVWAGWMLNGYSLSAQLILGAVGSAAGLGWLFYVRSRIRQIRRADAAAPV